VAKATSTPGATKTRATMVGKEKCANRTTVKRTAVGIQRWVMASSNHVRGMACKATPPSADESTSTEEDEEVEEDNK